MVSTALPPKRPVGTVDNSQAIHRWVDRTKVQSPAGTTDRFTPKFQPSLNGTVKLTCYFSQRSIAGLLPCCPYGTVRPDRNPGTQHADTPACVPTNSQGRANENIDWFYFVFSVPFVVKNLWDAHSERGRPKTKFQTASLICWKSYF